MTTIIIDCSEAKVYSDSCRTTNSYISVNGQEVAIGKSGEARAKKIHNLGDRIITGCGVSKVIDAFRETGVDTPIPKDCDNTTIFVVYKREGGVNVCTYKPREVGKWFSKRYIWECSSATYTKNYICAGSGSDYARGALAAGVSPAEAIVSASMCDPYTDSEVQVESFVEGD